MPLPLLGSGVDVEAGAWGSSVLASEVTMPDVWVWGMAERKEEGDEGRQAKEGRREGGGNVAKVTP